MGDLGWIKFHRAIRDHWVWQDDKYFRWWITILLTVNHSESKFPVGNDIHTCYPGQSFQSIDNWAALFRCSKKTVAKFFNLLENDSMIETKTVGRGNRRKHLLTVVNWSKYQQTETEKGTERKLETTPKGNPTLPSNKNDKNDKNEKNGRSLLVLDEFYPFDEFWEDYDKKVGDKDKLRKKWSNVIKSDRAKIKEFIPKYKISRPDKKFRKDPTTFLNQKSWNDEIINSPSDATSSNNYSKERFKSTFKNN